MTLLLFATPSAGTLAWGAALALLAALNAIQWYQREERHRLRGEVERWKAAAESGTTTVNFAQSELQVVRDRCQRLEADRDAQAKEIVTLRTRTDLDALSKALQNEGRRAQEAHEAILHGMENLAGSMVEMTKRISQMTEQSAERETQYAALINSQSDLIKSLQSQVNLKNAMRKAS